MTDQWGATKPVPSESPADPSATLLSKRFVSYAQNAEDVMLWRALGGVTNGLYIDVGAAEPIADSVTYAFYLRGWRGINIEPVSSAFERLLAARPNDINLNVAVGDHSGVTEFFLANGGNGLSTTIQDQADVLRHQGWQMSEVQVPIRTLSSIVDEFVRFPVHFLKIDAEGGERAVLLGARLKEFRPWIILIEATAPNSQEPTHSEWEDIVLDADYSFVWFDGLNRFYVSKEKMELASAFRSPPNVFDGFIRSSEAEACEQLDAMRSALLEARSREQGSSEHLQRLMGEHEMLQSEIGQLKAEIGQLKAEIGQLKAEIGQLKADRERQEHEAKSLQAEVSRVEAERDSWMQELYEINRYAAHLTRSRQLLTEEIAVLHPALKTLSQEVAALNQKIGAIYASTSWKLSAPIRHIGRLLGRR